MSLSILCFFFLSSACLEDFEMTSQVAEFVENFVSGPAGRTKDVIPNLCTLIGYIVAMPTEQSRKIFCLEGKAKFKIVICFIDYLSSR